MEMARAIPDGPDGPDVPDVLDVPDVPDGARVASVLESLCATRRRIVELRNERLAPGLALLHRTLYACESIVSALLDVEQSEVKEAGFIESQYSSSGLDAADGDAWLPDDGSSSAVRASRAQRITFLENMRDAASEIDGVVAVLQRQSCVQRFLSVDDNLDLLKAATADLLYSMATFGPLIDLLAETGSSLPMDVVEDYQRLIARLQEVSYIASVDVVASVQDVLIEVVSTLILSDTGLETMARGSSVDRMISILTRGDVTADWLLEEASRLYEAALVQMESGMYSMYVLFVLVAVSLVEGGVGKGSELVGRMELELDDLRRMWASVGRIEGAAQLKSGCGPRELSLRLLVFGVQQFQQGDRQGLAVLSQSLEYAVGPLTRATLLLAMGKLLEKSDVRGALRHEEMVGVVMVVSRWIENPAANVRVACASALAACLREPGAGSRDAADDEEVIQLRKAAHAAGIGKRLIRQLSRQQDVLGHRETLAALTASLTDDVAGELARAHDANLMVEVVRVMTLHLESPKRKGAEDVIRQAVKFLHGMVSRSPLARYKAVLASGVAPLERVLATKSSAYGRNFALLSLWQLSKVSSLAADEYGWSAGGVVSLMEVLIEETAPPSARIAALFTLKNILCRSDTTFETVSVTGEMLQGLVNTMVSGESDGVRAAAASVLERLVDGGGDSSPRMVDSIDRFKRQTTISEGGSS